ncbi:hypothetical protein NE237_006400 [Protea cynaroides]|uniref:Mediator of RNA polymerase II transcription subunit n=1 Tax=Protea cynaroides TaxID=273540 RepID=A0A9Q0KMF1_9MAGN|nr:hypothetical protein NE237_006400 [Protea cynaroides]
MVQTILSLSSFIPRINHLQANHRSRKTGLRHHCNRYPTTLSATGRDDCGDRSERGKLGKLVDENMIVLRMRIQEMKMVESSQEPPEDWMEWEKRYYTHYDSDICEAVGLLQTQLMKTRPSVALGMVALVTLCVPTSTFMVALHLMKMATGILSEIHLF